MSTFPEIIALQELYTKFDIEIKVSETEFLGYEDYPLVEFIIKNRKFKFFVDDEYQDFKIENPLLHLCLVLRELESYQEAEDYLVWCRQRMIDPTDSKARDNHMTLVSVYRNIQMILGEIDSQITDLDFQLNAGAAQELRRIT